jgi:hypothetical protein
MGKLVDVLLEEKQEAGKYRVTLDARGLPSGTYFYRIQAGEYAETEKMVLLK